MIEIYLSMLEEAYANPNPAIFDGFVEEMQNGINGGHEVVVYMNENRDHVVIRIATTEALGDWLEQRFPEPEVQNEAEDNEEE